MLINIYLSAFPFSLSSSVCSTKKPSNASGRNWREKASEGTFMVRKGKPRHLSFIAATIVTVC